MATSEEKEQWVLRAIKALRDLSKSNGIHVVGAGFNEAFRKKFGEDPRSFTEKMAAEGKIVIQLRRRGAMLYLPGEAPKATDPNEVMAKIDTFQD